jgi:DNA-binding MarR family transcriptional regulator
MSNKQSQYQILKFLEKDPGYTQRSISKDLDLDLGKVNYYLNSLGWQSKINLRQGLIGAYKDYFNIVI